MTNKEAINFLQSRIDLIDKYYPDVKDYREALVIAIEALEQKPCEDCISRQAAVDCFKKWQPYMATRLLDFEKELSELPPVTPQPKVGRWIFDEILDKHYYCSECKSMGVNYWDYCPNCGAKMEVGE